MPGDAGQERGRSPGQPGILRGEGLPREELFQVAESPVRGRGAGSEEAHAIYLPAHVHQLEAARRRGPEQGRHHVRKLRLRHREALPFADGVRHGRGRRGGIIRRRSPFVSLSLDTIRSSYYTYG